MKRCPEALREGPHDLLIIGGGITGACLAFDAATRGMRVALIDKGDFGAETSAASSKLLHGGLRYLQQLRFGKVRESARERLLFQNLAPHLMHYVPFVVPTYRSVAKSKAVLTTGMMLYETLCIGQSDLLLDPSRRVPAGRGLSAAAVEELIPGISREGLTGGRLFYESHMISSERVTLALIEGAVAQGATVANYVRGDEFLRDEGRIVGMRTTDLETGSALEIRARLVVNAAGPWIRELNADLGDGAATQPVTGFSRGVHLVTRPLTDGHAVALPTRRRSETVIDRGGRHIFIIPWRDRSLIGTSYGPHEGPLDDVRPTRGEITDLIADVNDALGPDTLTEVDVDYAFAGLYPLTADEIEPDKYQGSADYVIVDHEAADGTAGLFTVFGAKFTTARLLAELALDRITTRLPGEWGPCRTRVSALPSAPPAETPEGAGSFAADLRGRYGAHADAVARLAQDDDLREPLGEGRDVWEVDVIWAVREEMARHLDDVVFRRTGLGTIGDPGEESLRRVATLMAAELGWDDDRIEAEIARTQERFRW